MPQLIDPSAIHRNALNVVAAEEDLQRGRAARSSIPGALGGDPNALNALLQADPGAGMQVRNSLTQESAAQRQRLQQDVLGAASAVIVADPAQRPAAYQRSRQELMRRYPGQGFEQLSPEYNEGEFLGAVGTMFPPDVAEKIITQRFAGSRERQFGQQVIGFDDQNRPIVHDPGSGNIKTGKAIPGLRTAAQASTFDVSRERSLGKGVGEAQFSLPQQERIVDDTVRLVDELLAHPGKEVAVGFVAGRVPALTPEGKNFTARLDQIQGRAFLQARGMLKGGGQITDFESKKAEAAFIRAERAQTVEAFDAAMADFRGAVSEGYAKLQEQASMGPDGRGKAPQRAPAGGEADPLGIRY